MQGKHGSVVTMRLHKILLSNKRELSSSIRFNEGGLTQAAASPLFFPEEPPDLFLQLCLGVCVGFYICCVYRDRDRARRYTKTQPLLSELRIRMTILAEQPARHDAILVSSSSTSHNFPLLR